MKEKIQFQFNLFSKYRAEMMGISILGILVCHFYECRLHHKLPVSDIVYFLRNCNCFVDAFLLLSGIGLYYSFSKNHNIIRFYKKRLLKILPSYILIAGVYWMYYDLCVKGLSFKRVIFDLLFLNLFKFGTQRFWFVFAIIMLYILFPVFYKYIYKNDNTADAMIACCSTVIVMSAVFRILDPVHYGYLRIAVERIPVFVFGIYIGSLCRENRKIKPVYVLVYAIITVILWETGRNNLCPKLKNYVVYYAGSMMAVLLLGIFCVIFEGLSKLKYSFIINRFLKFLGSFTLEIYLFHSAVKNVMDYPGDKYGYILYAVLIPIPCAFVVHYIVSYISRRLH